MEKVNDQVGKIIITATFTAEPVNESLTFLLRKIGNDSMVEFTAHNQVFQQLLDPASITRTNTRGVNVFLIRFEDWTFESLDENADFQRVLDNLERSVNEFVGAVKAASFHASAPFLIVICPSSGNARSITKLVQMFDRMDDRVCRELNDVNGLYVVSKKTFTSRYSPSDYDDPPAHRLGRMPYTQSFYTTVGACLARMVHAIQEPQRKVIVLDCDQTLWLGTCGEDGPLGIELDHSRLALQRFMLQQHNLGRLLCLCSRNNEEDVLSVFSMRPEMPLNPEHFVARRINWKPKSENLKQLAAELNLGLESFIFVDDDPVVCAEVETNCPEVLTLRLPAATEQVIPFLNNMWAFDSLKQTNEDKERTRLYREESLRAQLRRESPNLQDFFNHLDMRIEIAPMQAPDIPRVAQLTQRTNQFNFNINRCSETGILQLSTVGKTEFLVVTVRDRFGDYGIVGLFAFRRHGTALDVEMFLLSCRALGRGVEHRMLARLGEVCLERDIEYVNLHYRATDKNKPAFEFIRTLEVENHRDIDGAEIFSLRAHYAAAVKLNEHCSVSFSGSTSHPNGSSAAPCALTKSAALSAIAVGLSEPQQLLVAIQAENRKRARASEPDAPADNIKVALKQIWESVLGLDGIGLDQNFFESGGDSIRAVRLFSEIEKRFGRQLPLTTILETPTINKLAAVLRTPENGNNWSPLVPLQAKGTRPPLYCIHAAGGNVLFYRDLVKYLGPDQPLYGLQARGMNRGHTTHDNVEDMAAYYLAAIRAFQPEGPYHLGGSSFGGLVAYEMACQLERAGEQVALLALFDTHGPDYPQPAQKRSLLLMRVSRWLDHVNLFRENLSLMDPAKRVGYLSNRVTKVTKVVQRQFLWRTNSFARKLSFATGSALPRDLQDNHKAIERAQQNYNPKPYRGLVTLFRASRQPSGIVSDPSLGWKNVALGGLEIYEVRGFHGAVTVEPHAPFLAAQLVPCLRRAQRAERTESVAFEMLCLS